MVEGNFGVSLFILLFGGAFLSFVGYRNCYLTEEQQNKADYIAEAFNAGLELDHYDDCIVTYRYRIGKEKLKFLSMVISILAAIGFVARNILATFTWLKPQGLIGILVALFIIVMIVAVVAVLSNVLYLFVMGYEKIGAKNLHDEYYRNGVVLIEEKKDKLFEQLIEESRR